MALATLGLFVFSLPTIPLQDWDEGHAWRHPSQTTVGGSGQPTQFTGKDNDTLTISAELRPEITGGDLSIEVLKRMADTGQPWPLVRGGGKEDLRAVFDKSAALMRQGAMGMVYGRNIYQHANPGAVVRGLMEIIHKDASGEEAFAVYQQG